MNSAIDSGAHLSDSELLLEVKRLSSCEQQATSRLVAALGELDARRLYLAEGCSSLFTYCTQVLHLSEHATYLRIETARAARKWPAIVGLIADGSLHLTAVSLVAPHLTDENHRDVLARARHKTKREVEEMIAALRPRPTVPSSVRKLPVPRTPSAADDDRSGSPPAAPFLLAIPNPPSAQTERRPSPAAVKPLAAERYKVQFTVSRETHGRLREAQDLLRHRIPDGDVGAIFERALAVLLTDLHRTRHADSNRPLARRPKAPHGRHIPASVKREVWSRDDGRCAFVGLQGRCSERGFLEFHHVVPYAEGGQSTAGNLELRCRPHNAFEAERWFGTREEDLVREAAVAYVVKW